MMTQKVVLAAIVATMLTGVSVCSAAPDLKDGGDTWRTFNPRNVGPGDTLVVNFYLQLPPADVLSVGPFKIRYYASKDTTITSTDPLLGELGYSSLNYPGVMLAVTIQVPSNLPCGEYYVGWIIDADNQVAESNESNNVAYVSAFTLIVGGECMNNDDDGGLVETCLGPGSRVVLTEPILVIQIYPNPFTPPMPGHAGTVLCTDEAGRLLVSWDCWSSGGVGESDDDCVGEPIGSYPPGSALWVDPGSVACPFDACGTLDYTWSATGGVLTFTPDTADTGVSAVKLDPGVMQDPDVAGLVAMGLKVRLQGLLHPEGSWQCNWTGTASQGPCVEHPIVSACNASAPPTCCPQNHVAVGDRVTLCPIMFLPFGAPPIGHSGTVVCCSGDNVLVSWDLMTTGTASAASCTGTPPAYIPPGSLSWVICCALGRAVDLCGTVISKPGVTPPCTPYVVFREDDATYNDIPLYNTSFNVGDEVRVRGVYGCNNSDIILAGCLRPNMLMVHPILSLGCQDGGGCLPDLVPYMEPVWNFEPGTVDVCTTPDQIRFTFGVKNQGCSASGAYTVCFYASKNSTITASDYLLASLAMNSLSPGDSITGMTGWFQLDVGQVPPGEYYVGWIVDGQREVRESSETNNAAVVGFKTLCVQDCGGGGGGCTADLVTWHPTIEGFYPATIQAGQSMSITFGAENQGLETVPPGWRIRFYASTNSTISTADYLLDDVATVSITPLDPGDKSILLHGFIFPSGIPAGQYYVGWILDSNNDVCESGVPGGESNNTGYISGTKLTVQ